MKPAAGMMLAWGFEFAIYNTNRSANKKQTCTERVAVPICHKPFKHVSWDGWWKQSCTTKTLRCEEGRACAKVNAVDVSPSYSLESMLSRAEVVQDCFHSSKKHFCALHSNINLGVHEGDPNLNKLSQCVWTSSGAGLFPSTVTVKTWLYLLSRINAHRYGLTPTRKVKPNTVGQHKQKRLTKH